MNRTGTSGYTGGAEWGDFINEEENEVEPPLQQ